MSDEALSDAALDRRGLRTGANEPTFHRALNAVAKALDDAQVPHLFIGGVASMVHGRTSWTHDLDVMVAPRDQPAALEALVAAGFEVLPSPASWLSKLGREDVVVDVIHAAAGPIFLDAEMLDRSVVQTVWDTEIRVIGPEDLVVTKAVAHDEETPHYWWDALAVLAAREVDWDYLVFRARRGPRRVLSLLLYAQSSDLAVPDTAVRRLLALVMPDTSRPETEHHDE
jgi:predicted nucleotidyltransferase